jgi:hypothetical protein
VARPPPAAEGRGWYGMVAAFAFWSSGRAESHSRQVAPTSRVRESRRTIGTLTGDGRGDPSTRQSWVFLRGVRAQTSARSSGSRVACTPVDKCVRTGRRVDAREATCAGTLTNVRAHCGRCARNSRTTLLRFRPLPMMTEQACSRHSRRRSEAGQRTVETIAWAMLSPASVDRRREEHRPVRGPPRSLQGPHDRCRGAPGPCAVRTTDPGSARPMRGLLASCNACQGSCTGGWTGGGLGSASAMPTRHRTCWPASAMQDSRPFFSPAGMHLRAGCVRADPSPPSLLPSLPPSPCAGRCRTCVDRQTTDATGAGLRVHRYRSRQTTFIGLRGHS